MITRGISVFEAFPSTSVRRCCIYNTIDLLRGISFAVLFIYARLAVSQCVVKHTPSIVIWLVRTTFSSLSSCVSVSKAALTFWFFEVDYICVGLLWLPQRPNVYFPTLPPFSLKSCPNIECLVSKGTYNPVRSCQH